MPANLQTTIHFSQLTEVKICLYERDSLPYVNSQNSNNKNQKNYVQHPFHIDKLSMRTVSEY